jgi:hypothetical protein
MIAKTNAARIALLDAGFARVSLRRDMDGRVVVMVATPALDLVARTLRDLPFGYAYDRVGDAVRVAAR